MSLKSALASPQIDLPAISARLDGLDPDQPGELLVDYLRLPPLGPDGGPPILSNSARLSYFVYNQTQDVLRGVSKHVSIGRAFRSGKVLDNWFVLCRPAD